MNLQHRYFSYFFLGIVLSCITSNVLGAFNPIINNGTESILFYGGK